MTMTITTTTFPPPPPPPLSLSPPTPLPSFFELPPPLPPIFLQLPPQLPSSFQFFQNNRQQPTNFLQEPKIGAATKFGELEAVRGEQEIDQENIKNETDDLMEGIPSPPQLELSDGIVNVLKDAEDIINNDFISEKDLDEKDIEDIKREYNSEDIKNTLDEKNILEFLEFFYGRDTNQKCCINCEMLSIDGDMTDFINILCSPKGEELLHENSISIHLETGNIFYDNFNTQESFYDFLLNQQNENKKQ